MKKHNLTSQLTDILAYGEYSFAQKNWSVLTSLIQQSFNLLHPGTHKILFQHKVIQEENIKQYNIFEENPINNLQLKIQKRLAIEPTRNFRKHQ